jgi:hypothetical protein
VLSACLQPQASQRIAPDALARLMLGLALAQAPPRPVLRSLSSLKAPKPSAPSTDLPHLKKSPLVAITPSSPNASHAPRLSTIPVLSPVPATRPLSNNFANIVPKEAAQVVTS